MKIKLKDYKIIEQLDDFRYLGSTVSSDGSCKKEIARPKWHLRKKEVFLHRRKLT